MEPSLRRPPPPPPPPHPQPPPSLNTVVAAPPPQPPRSCTLSSLPPRELIGLDSRRAHTAAKNDYVESPSIHRHTRLQQLQQQQHHHQHGGTVFNHCGGSNGSGAAHTNGHGSSISSSSSPPTVTTQPQSHHSIPLPDSTSTSQTSVLAKKGGGGGGAGGLVSVPSVLSAGSGLDLSSGQGECKSSIYCPNCNKCRCRQCTEHKELPQAWLCNKCVDWTSCLCAVRGAFYHCCCGDTDGDVNVSPTDEPCACCEQPHCCRRWVCIGLMTLVLPCLCLYWPLRCGQHIATHIYNRCCRRNGCRCRRDRVPGTKGLLMDSESSSA